jgi:hypothetical protein
MNKGTEAVLAEINRAAHHAKTVDDWGEDENNFHDVMTPDVALQLIAALEQLQRYAKQCDEENQDLMLTIGRFRVEREQLEASKLSVKLPDEFTSIGENLRNQDNRFTSDPMFCVFQKREIVVDEDYDCDRIVWVDEDGREATERQRMRLELLHQNFREPPEKWRRVAVKDIDDFVTCCFTEQGCKDYLACNGHNLRLPFIYVKSGFRNAEYQTLRNWLMSIGTVEGSD